MEETYNQESMEFDINDIDTSLDMVEVPKEKEEVKPEVELQNKQNIRKNQEEIPNCLRNERIIVRYLPKSNGIWGDNPRHVLAGGMSENATKTFVVPKLSSGIFVNVLTDNEKAFLEEAMGLEYNALSVYKKVDNFWSDATENGINRVRLTKQDNYLDLSNPEDYIRYKILLANKDYIAPSLQAYQDSPKATYQFVIISASEENNMAKVKMTTTMKCYKEFGKIENDTDTLRVIIETLEGKPTSPSSKLEFLQTKANDLIQSNSKLFLQIITDPMLPTKVLIKKAIEGGLISKRGDYLYLKSDGSPLCELNEEPTLNIAAKYLNSPKHQELKFSLEARLK